MPTTDIAGDPRVVDRASSDSLAATRLVARWPVMRPFVTIGSVSIVIGGLVAAVARPLDFDLGSWLAAYLVLVAGVAQLVLGVGQAWLADEVPSPGLIRVQLVAWNLGVAATVVGSLASVPVMTTIGAVATVVALVAFFRGVGPRPRGRDARWPRLLYRGLILVVLVSTPIGLVLAWLRHG